MAQYEVRIMYLLIGIHVIYCKMTEKLCFNQIILCVLYMSRYE